MSRHGAHTPRTRLHSGTAVVCLLLCSMCICLPFAVRGEQIKQGNYAPFSTPIKQQTVTQTRTKELPPPVQDDPRAPLSPRQRDLIIARILSRQGYYPDALKVYTRLVRHYPGDLAIYGYYAETLIDHGNYDRAQHALFRALQQSPDNVRLLSLKARVHLEHDDFRSTYPIFQKILEKQPDDLGTMADFAYAARSAGDWQRAMNLYRRILQADPDNDNAYRAVSEIARERATILAAATRLYNQSGNSQTNSFTARYEAQLANRVRIEISQLAVDIRRLEQEFTPSIHKQLNLTETIVHYELSPRVKVYGGLAPYYGYRDSFAPSAGLRYEIGRLGTAGAEYVHDMPWYDPVDAVLNDGNYDTLRFTYERFINDNWSVNFAAELWEYRLGDQHYGEKKTFSGQISRRLPIVPGLFISYGYFRSKFNYMDEDFTPVVVLNNEAVHTVSLYLQRHICRYITLVLTGGVSQDEFKPRNNYFFAPSLRFRVGNRIELNTGFEYQSDENTADGGESTTFTTDLKILF